MENGYMQSRQTWIDFARGIAVLSVVFDHAFVIYPNFYNIWLAKPLIFSIPWFIFLSAVTNTYTFKMYPSLPKTIKYFWRKRLHLVLIYALSSLCIYSFNPLIPKSFTGLLTTLLTFSATPPYYFFFILFQFYFIFPFVYLFIRKNKIITIPVIFSVSLFISAYITRINGGWDWSLRTFIFGGPYLTVFILGCIYPYLTKYMHNILTVLSGIIYIGITYFLIYSGQWRIAFTPNILTISWSIAFLVIVKFLTPVFIRIKLIEKVFSVLGRKSLWIFLFHYPILYFGTHPFIIYGWIRFIALIGTAIFIPVCFSFLFKILRKTLSKHHSLKKSLSL
jgi:peptidoglycan/LPS O-acetylase OafA/YrhL